MSDQNPTTPDPSDAVPGYEPPATSEPATPPAAPEPPAYAPPSTGGYEPPAAPVPPAYTPPAAPEPPTYTPPPTGGYEPPVAGGYAAPAAGGYAPPPSGAGFPEPPGPGAYPPPGAGYTDPNAAYGYPPAPMPPMGGAGALADWPKRALGGLVDYVAAGVVLSIVGGVLSNISSSLGSIVNAVLGIAWMCYLGYKSGTTGVTFGRSLAKTKLISAETGQPIGVTNGIIRQFAHIIDSIICYIGRLFPLWDAKKQTIADKVMKTVVIDNSADPNAGTYNWG